MKRAVCWVNGSILLHPQTLAHDPRLLFWCFIETSFKDDANSHGDQLICVSVE